jgi:hypothetical protein
MEQSEIMLRRPQCQRDPVPAVPPEQTTEILAYLRTLFPEKERGGWGKSPRGGFYIEELVRQRLVDAGALVTKSGGSRGPFDLVAVVPGRFVLGIQVKRGAQKWQTPVRTFGCFHPVLLTRRRGRWDIEIPTV